MLQHRYVGRDDIQNTYPLGACKTPPVPIMEQSWRCNQRAPFCYWVSSWAQGSGMAGSRGPLGAGARLGSLLRVEYFSSSSIHARASWVCHHLGVSLG